MARCACGRAHETRNNAKGAQGGHSQAPHPHARGGPLRLRARPAPPHLRQPRAGPGWRLGPPETGQTSTPSPDCRSLTTRWTTQTPNLSTLNPAPSPLRPPAMTSRPAPPFPLPPAPLRLPCGRPPGVRGQAGPRDPDLRVPPQIPRGGGGGHQQRRRARRRRRRGGRGGGGGCGGGGGALGPWLGSGGGRGKGRGVGRHGPGRGVLV